MGKIARDVSHSAASFGINGGDPPQVPFFGNTRGALSRLQGEDLSRGSEKEAKREFLKDVTAFANAAGGHLFLGVKEPSKGVPVESQLVGLDNGDAVAQAFERLASTSIDSRIPGLRIVPVPLANGRSCVAIHIPPSLSRPHMVDHVGHRSFYVRHSESSIAMTTHEVREAVLTSSSAEARARLFVERRLSEVRNEIGDRQATFFLQAMPLISPESPWDVLGIYPLRTFFEGKHGAISISTTLILRATSHPRPTIDGLLGQDQHEQLTWETEVHRTGYISLLYRDIQIHRVGEVDRFVVHYGTCDIFRAFCHMLKECLDVSATDVPYLVACAYLNAEGTCLWTESRWGKFSDPYKKRGILWPEHLRATGTNPMPIAESLCLEMFNAFGFREIVK